MIKSKILKKISFTKMTVIITSITVLLAGCLSFGDDVQTGEPTADQIRKCRRLMYLRDDLVLQAEGYKITHGIDVAIWFKFTTAETSASEIFIDSIVDIWRFEDSFSLYPQKDMDWWDVKGKNLFGEVVELPNTKFMSVGIERYPRGSTVYIFWNEI